MTTAPNPSQRPAIAVLCSADVARPDLTQIADRVDLRFTDAAGLAAALPGARALLLWDFFSSALRHAWPRADSLEWIHIAAAGVDTLLFDDLVASPVTVTHARGVFDRPIAEFVLASILAQLKQLHRTRDLQRQRRWLHRETGTVVGQRVLVVGTGGIGREIGRLASLLGARVRGAGRTARGGDDIFETIIASDTLTEHIGWAEHIVIATPLTTATRGLIDADVLAAVTPGAHLVNIARGPVVDEDALLEALHAGRLGAASLDVFTTEPLPPDSPLWEAPNIVISPHMSGDVAGWRDTLAQQFLDNAERFLAGEPLLAVVDKRLGFAAPEGPRP